MTAPLDRRGDDLWQILGRLDERTALILRHQQEQNGRTDKLEARMDAVEGQLDRQAGASQERGRWLGLAVAVGQKAIPAGGGIAGLLALAHYWSGQSR